MFIGFQQRNNGGTGADLWNNNPPSFGLLIPGNGSGGLVLDRVSVGGNAGGGRYQVAPGYGTASAASIVDGFTVSLTVDSSGWDLALTGLEDAGGNAITGESGTWGVDGINTWAGFNDAMRVGVSYQTTATGGTLNLARITLIRNSTLDTDMDGMPDDYEDATPGLDKNLAADAAQGANDGLFDDDGLTNLEEFNLGTDPNVADTDGDGLNDGLEVSGESNPYLVGHTPGDPPAGNPPDGAPTDPRNADSDGDGVMDGAEVNGGNGSVTDPNDRDTDDDLMDDGYEIANTLLGGLDPLVDDADSDLDGDGLSNLAEFDPFQGPNTGSVRTRADMADTDSDGYSDLVEDNIGSWDSELLTGTDPTNPDSDGDGLLDGHENPDLVGDSPPVYDTDPNLGDTDGDTFKDFIEIEAGSNANEFTSTPTFPKITWTVEAFDEETDLSTEGALLFADNLQGGDVTVNGIPFTGRIVDGTGRSTPHLQTLLGNSSPPTSTPGLYDGEVPALIPLLSVFWFQGDPLAGKMGITGLTPGKTYLMQVGRADDRGGTLLDRYMLADGFGGGNVLDPIGPTNSTYGGPANPAVLFTGTFTAQYTVQGFSWEQYLPDGTLLGSHLPFIQVREIEPVTEITVTDVRRVGVTVEVSFSGLNPARSYQLVRSAGLQDGFPTVVDGPRTPAGVDDMFSDPSPPTGEAYYRLEELP
jgi:hypothetical protein